MTPKKPHPATGRRAFLQVGALAAGAGAVGITGAALAHKGTSGQDSLADANSVKDASPRIGQEQLPAQTPAQTVPFFGAQQAFLRSAAPQHIVCLALDLKPEVTAEDQRVLLRLLSDDAARLTQGKPALGDMDPDLAATPNGLTVTFGFSHSFVERTGAERPEWLAPLPAFPQIDKLDSQWSDGELLLQIAGNDLTAIAHTQRVLLKDARKFSVVRWIQRGFRQVPPEGASTHTMRNLFGQLDGTVNAPIESDLFTEQVICSQPQWLQGGTSCVIRRIAMDLDRWDELDQGTKQSSLGRHLKHGAPLSEKVDSPATEAAEPNFSATTSDGLPLIAQDAHVRRAHVSDPALRIVRRGYNYDEQLAAGAGAEGQVSNSGLLFISYQANVLTQFVPMQQRLAESDALNTWTVPIGSAVFAIAPGCAEGEFVGQGLFSA